MAKNNNSQLDENVIRSRPTNAEDQEWVDFVRTEKRETPKRLEDIGKFLSAVMAASLTFVNTTGHDLFNRKANDTWLKVGVIFWLLAIVFSFIVIFPFHYKYVENSAQSIKRTYERIVRIKMVLLVISSLCFLIGMFTISLRSLFF